MTDIFLRDHIWAEQVGDSHILGAGNRLMVAGDEQQYFRHLTCSAYCPTLKKQARFLGGTVHPL
jgi:hypothetical protein